GPRRGAARGAARAGRGRLVRQGGVAGGATFQDHALGFEEGEQPFAYAFAADPGLLEPAERHAEVTAERVVADRPRTQLPGNVAGPLDVVGEHRRVEAVHRVVRDGDRLPLVRRRDHAQHRAEDLFLADDRGVVDVAEDGWLDEPAPVQVFRAAAASGQRRALRHALGDIALDAVPLTARCQRTHLRLLVERVAYPNLCEDVGHGREQVIVAIPGHHDPGQRGTDLTGQEACHPG